MASFQKQKNGHVRAFVHVNGFRESKTLRTKKTAIHWACEREKELEKLNGLACQEKTFEDLFIEYIKKVSPTKRGAKWEIRRLELLIRDHPALSTKTLIHSELSDFEDWMAHRLQKVSPSTVNRELNLISNTLTMARKWRWMNHNPTEELIRPKNPPARERRISQEEIEKICLALGYKKYMNPIFKRQFVGAAFLFAIETAMRAGEICQLTRSNIDLEKSTALLMKTKNGDTRKVPLSPTAKKILESLLCLLEPSDNETPVFQLTPNTLDGNFRKYRNKTDIEDLTFHDTRHEATTRLATTLPVLDLARVTGHRDINELLTYYNKSAEDIATELSKKNEDINKKVDYSKLAAEMFQHMKQIAAENNF